jgi:hypothetical protein
MFEYLDFTDEIKGFARPEYLVILLSFVYGFSLSDQFFHFSVMIKRRRFYSETIIWSNLIMLGLIIYWYLLWRHITEIDNSMLIFLSNFLPALLLFVIISLLYPAIGTQDYNPEKTFVKNRRWIFITTVLFISSVMYNSWLLNHYFTPLNYVRTGHLIFIIPCIFIDKKLVRFIAATWLLGWYLTLMFIISI